ncbi:MAG: thioredoxin [Bacteroidaceae bacterium]|jgi:thioredoxin 1|nr:thioredoxin [Bacteroidaceae bacterium]MBO7660758.1 thioredoxin [Bacteroidaceae bacterium]MBQ1666333.1 thioredoxin [Bacteroidaceae bacterium]MBQ2180650.1 thioredoxin [Bacteroidaceae bacterium]MBQ2199373.1 thioredoxin [Bacteroidaceae bacterium]
MVITNDNFESVMNSGKPVVLDFWATWCGPCKKIAPVIEELAEQYADQVIVGKVDVEENDDISFKYGIRNIPTVLFIKDGQVVDKIVGATAKAAYEEKIKALL